MINIDLLYDVPIGMFTSNENVTVNRIGDILLMTNDADRAARPPWETFGIGYDWQVMSGLGVESQGFIVDIVTITLKDYDIRKILNLYSRDQSFSLSLIQQNENNGLQSAVSSGCSLVGTKIEYGDAKLYFTMPNCEMIYNL